MLTFLLLITLTVPSALTVIGNSKGMSKEWGATIERINGRDASRRNMHGMLHKIDAASQNLKAQGKSKNIRKYIITNHEGRNFPRRKKQTSSGAGNPYQILMAKVSIITIPTAIIFCRKSLDLLATMHT